MAGDFCGVAGTPAASKGWGCVIRVVGVSSYLSFTLRLSVFMMLELIEAVSGRLIGPKSWNRSVKIMKPIWCSP